MKRDYKINFHQSFPVTIDYLGKLLSLPEANSGYTKEEIAEKTGIPTGKSSGKVVPHIQYAKYCNLLDYEVKKGKYKLKLTELGKLIKIEDNKISEEITLEIILYFLSSKNIGADQWYYIMRELLGQKNLTEDFIQTMLKKRYGLDKKILLGPVKNTYINNNTNYIASDKEIFLCYKKPSKEKVYAYAYTLITEIENEYLFNGRREIIIEELDILKWREGHLLSLQDSNKVLNWLEEKGILRMNKQLNPTTIICLKNSKEILPLLYSLLL